MAGCPCISQTNDSLVRCQREAGHDGLHSWVDPVHPGHSKMWSGSITEPTTDTRYRFESSAKRLMRFGCVADGTGRTSYLPMAGQEEEDLTW